MIKILSPLSATFIADQPSTMLRGDQVIEIHVPKQQEARHDFSFSLSEFGLHLMRITLEGHATLRLSRTLHVSDSDTRGTMIVLARLGEDAQLFVDDVMFVEGKKTNVSLCAKVVLDKGAKAQVRQYARVGKKAEGSIVSEICRALVCDVSAIVSAIPELEVQTDDAVTSHAASVTKPDERMTQYLVSRGCDKQRAQQLVCDGFLQSYV